MSVLKCLFGDFFFLFVNLLNWDFVVVFTIWRHVLRHRIIYFDCVHRFALLKSIFFVIFFSFLLAFSVVLYGRVAAVMYGLLWLICLIN